MALVSWSCGSKSCRSRLYSLVSFGLSVDLFLKVMEELEQLAEQQQLLTKAQSACSILRSFDVPYGAEQGQARAACKAGGPGLRGGASENFGGTTTRASVFPKRTWSRTLSAWRSRQG